MPRKKDDLVVPMFDLVQIAPAEAERLAAAARKKADNAARREAAKLKRERTEADDERKLREFNERQAKGDE